MTIAALLTTVGMLLLGTKAATVPSSPLQEFLVMALLATILAGIGNVFAAGAAALLLGIGQGFAALFMPSEWTPLLIYVLMAIAIVLFPGGVRLSALAGATLTSQFGLETSTTLLTMVVFGGTATIWGPLLGAAVLTLVPQAIQFLSLPVSVSSPLQGIIFSILVLVFLFLRPQGLMGGRRGGGLDAWSGRRRLAPA